jgi:hypothetical protein
MLLATKRRPRRESGNALPRPDGRTLPARRYKQLMREFQAEIGGPGQVADTDEAVRLASESRRILVALKTKAETNKPVGPTLQDYLVERSKETSV